VDDVACQLTVFGQLDLVHAEADDGCIVHVIRQVGVVAGHQIQQVAVRPQRAAIEGGQGGARGIVDMGDQARLDIKYAVIAIVGALEMLRLEWRGAHFSKGP
jgi:hypothetical protein